MTDKKVTTKVPSTVKIAEPKSLKAALDELATITEWFQQDAFDLESGLEKMQQGAQLVAWARKRLQTLENSFEEVRMQLDDATADDSDTDTDAVMAEDDGLPF